MGTVWHYFFDEDGAGVTENLERHVTMLHNVLWPHLEALEINIA